MFRRQLLAYKKTVQRKEKAKKHQTELQAEEERKQEHANLVNQIQSLEQELNAVPQTKERLQRLENENTNLTHEINVLQARLSHDDACLTEAQKLAEAMEQQMQHIQMLYEAKLLQLEKEAHEQSARSQETVELRKRYENLKENYESLRQTNEQLKEKLIESEHFLRTQEGKVAATFEKQLAEARCECAQAKADRDDFEANLETCKRQLQLAREQNASLRAYLEEEEEGSNKENVMVVTDRTTTAPPLPTKSGFISNAIGQARRTFGNFK